MFLWKALVFALHLLALVDPSGLSMEARIFLHSEILLDAKIRREATGNYRIEAASHEGIATLERSRLFGQVYTVFSPWDMIPSIEGISEPSTRMATENSTTESTRDGSPAYAAGSMPPLVIDLTSLLVQTRITDQGSYNLNWPQEAFGSTNQEEGASQGITVIVDRRGITLSMPSSGLILNLFRNDRE